MSEEPLLLVPPPVARLLGTEQFSRGEASVASFWSWAFSDLRSNALRGLLAEYLVALALDAADGTRTEWDDHDVTTAQGIRVEVKSSAYLQSWPQRALSRIVFSGLTGRTWTAERGYAAERSNNADVYVFALQICKEHSRYDALNVDQWEFHVLPARAVVGLRARSVGYAALQRMSTGAVSWASLAEAVRAVVSGMPGHEATPQESTDAGR